MKEDFLHYVWKYKLFNTSNLLTTNNEEITIINSGQHNTNAGPDFFNGKVIIGSTTWAGNIEIHINSSDWLAHKHQNDKAYENVVLHVVFNDDKVIYDINNNPIPTLELKKILSSELIDKNNYLQVSKDWVACQKQINTVDNFTINTWLNRLAVERLERKSEEIQITLKQNKNDWEQTFYQYLFKYFGLKVNALPFEQLAINTPVKIAEKHNELKFIEALYFGQAGFLKDDIEDDYYVRLKKEYQFLKAKFSLKPIDKSLWKLLRLRPASFPTIRISQLANLLNNETRLFSKLLDATSVKAIEEIFKVSASEYWKTHYQFGVVVGKSSTKKVGKILINTLIINVVVPFLFVYGKQKQDEKFLEKALNFLESIKSENNSIITKWYELNVASNNAMQSQALLELKNNYCSQKKCLNCSIGSEILQQ
ncbi:MAG: DUF2851 family protein [Vicingaceae bacterium]|nr:DUF2851 family protein [Vicingaceae bacterium]